MKKSGTSLLSALERYYERVSGRLAQERELFRTKTKSQLPILGKAFYRDRQRRSLQTGLVTNVIIISLSYPGMRRNEDGGSMELNGTKHDLTLLLRHFDYRHNGNATTFTILNDFDFNFTDSTGVQRVIRSVDTSRNSIRSTIQKIMRNAEPDDKILFFFGGHGQLAEVSMAGLREGHDSEFQVVIAGDGRMIYGKELRSWFCDARYPTVSVTAVFDTCCSGGSLGLPYDYYPSGDATIADKVARVRVPIPMVQISAAQPDQVAYSTRYDDGYYGQLTHSLIGYLKGTDLPTIEGLVHYLEKNCDPSGTQLPQVSTSVKVKGQVSLFPRTASALSHSCSKAFTPLSNYG